ncbi:MAG: SMI1/KNR4 family protein [Rivularia sp. (in: cyanobacteria)]
MSLLTESLEQILIQLEQKDPEIASSLQPGLTREEIDQIANDLPFKLPEEVYELYQWQNGISGSIGFGYGAWNGISAGFSSLEVTIQYLYNSKKRNCPSNFLFIFSFVHHLGGDYFGISLDDKTHPVFNFYEDDERYIKNINHSFIRRRTISSDLTTLMYATAECLKNAMYSETNSNGYTSLEFDEDKVKHIFNKYRQGNFKIYKI